MALHHVGEAAGYAVDGTLITGGVTAPWWWPYFDLYGHGVLFCLALIVGGLRVYSWRLKVKIQQKELELMAQQQRSR